MARTSDPEPESEPPEGRSLARNVGVLFGSQMVTWSISLALIVVVPRVLGPTSIGQFTLVTSVWAIIVVGVNAGTGQMLTLEVARNRSSGAAIISPVVVARCGLFLVASAGMALYLLIADVTPIVAFVFVVLGVAALAQTLGDVGREALQGYEDLDAVGRADIAWKLLNVGSVLVVLLAFGFGLRAYAIVTAVTTILHAVLLHWFLRRYARVRLRLDIRSSLSALRRSNTYFVAAFLMVVYHQLDVVIMSMLVDDEQVGWYSAADRLFGTALFVPSIVMTAVFPVLARLHEQDPASAKDLVSRGFRTLLIFGVPIGFGTMALSRPIAELLFGPEFSEAGPVLAVIGVVLMITFQTILLGHYAVATGRQRYFVVLMAIAIVMTVPLDLVLVPWTNRVFDNGAIGGVLAYVVTELFILTVAIAKLTPEVASWQTLRRLGHCLLAAGAMVAAIYPLRDVFPLIGVGVGALVYVVAIIVQRPFDEEERSSLSGLGQSIKTKLPSRRSA